VPYQYIAEQGVCDGSPVSVFLSLRDDALLLLPFVDFEPASEGPDTLESVLDTSDSVAVV
jgi:hypothetical protein